MGRRQTRFTLLGLGLALTLLRAVPAGAQIVPHVQIDGMVSTIPGSGPTGQSGASLASIVGLASVSEGNATRLVSQVGTGWRGVTTAKLFVQAYAQSFSVSELVSGVDGSRPAVYEWDLTLSSLASVGFYQCDRWGTIDRTIAALWSAEYGSSGAVGPPGGIAKNMAGSYPEPFERFRSGLGSSICVGSSGNSNARIHVNILWSMK